MSSKFGDDESHETPLIMMEDEGAMSGPPKRILMIHEGVGVGGTSSDGRGTSVDEVDPYNLGYIPTNKSSVQDDSAKEDLLGEEDDEEDEDDDEEDEEDEDDINYDDIHGTSNDDDEDDDGDEYVDYLNAEGVGITNNHNSTATNHTKTNNNSRRGLPSSTANRDGSATGSSRRGKEGLTLKQQVAKCCKYLDIGAAVLHGPLFTADVEDYGGSEELRDAVASMPETHYSRILRREFNAIVIEHHLKWSPLLSIDLHPPGTTAINSSTRHSTNKIKNSSTSPPKLAYSASVGGVVLAGGEKPRLGRYDFYYADSIVDWAITKGIKKIKGHVLVWHVTTPRLLEELEPKQVRDELKRHIFTVMGHFRGRITVWDVVNEALAPDGSLAENVFLRKLGPSYIEDSFRWAHQADPDAILLYNDNKVEGYGTKKANGFYELLADLKAKNVPVHGCGLQAHWNAAGTGLNRPPTPRMLKQQIRRLGKLGLTVNLSELDVRVSKLNPPELRNIAQRQIYHDLVAAAISEPAVDGIWLWGFTDRHTWVSNFYYDDEPLILDEYYQRKPAYYGLRDAFATLCPGHTVASGYNSTGHNHRGDGGPAQTQPQFTTPKIIPLSSDVDEDGNAWGHLWMQPDPEVDLLDNNNGLATIANPGGDARPDWELSSSVIVQPQLHHLQKSPLTSRGILQYHHDRFQHQQSHQRTLPPSSIVLTPTNPIQSLSATASMSGSNLNTSTSINNGNDINVPNLLGNSSPQNEDDDDDDTEIDRNRLQQQSLGGNSSIASNLDVETDGNQSVLPPIS